VLPRNNSFLYGESVYLTAEGTEIPQLKRVIVVAGNKVAMELTLDEAIKAVFRVLGHSETASSLDLLAAH